MNGPSFERTETFCAAWKELPDAVDDLWDACMQEQQGSDVARALTANFVGVAAAPYAGCLIDATEQLQRRSPCRAFLLAVDDDAPLLDKVVAAELDDGVHIPLPHLTYQRMRNIPGPGRGAGAVGPGPGLAYLRREG